MGTITDYFQGQIPPQQESTAVLDRVCWY